MISRHEVDYLRPVDYGDPVRIELWVEELRAVPLHRRATSCSTATCWPAGPGRCCVPFDLAKQRPAPADATAERSFLEAVRLVEPDRARLPGRDAGAFLARLLRLDPARWSGCARPGRTGWRCGRVLPWGVLVTRTVAGRPGDATVSAAELLRRRWLAGAARCRRRGRPVALAAAAGGRPRRRGGRRAPSDPAWPRPRRGTLRDVETAGAGGPGGRAAGGPRRAAGPRRGHAARPMWTARRSRCRSGSSRRGPDGLPRSGRR